MRKRLLAMTAAGVLAATTMVVAPVAAAADEPAVGSATVTPIQVTGDPSERFNLVVLGDGYTAAELPKFRAQVEEHMNVMWSIEPYKSYRNYFNVYAVEIVSGVSGVSCDNQLTSPRKDTPLKMAFWGGCSASSVQRLLTMNNTAAQTYARMAPKVDQILALANSDTYGGAGGSYATASGGNAMSALISPHELGHSLGGLQDEYDYYTRGVTTGDYKGSEPSSKHLTLLTEQQMRDQQAKWWRWLGEPSESGGIIGRYEGGNYYSTGIFRPSRHSIMKTLGYYYDQVSREVMTERIASKTPLAPQSTPTTGPVAPDQVLWVQTAHPVSHQIDVTWAVNGTAVAGTANARQLALKDRNVKAGDTVTATLVDNTEFVRDPALRAKPSMTQVRTWTVGSGSAGTPAVPAQITGSTMTDRAAGATDVLYIDTTHPADHDYTTAWKIDGQPVNTPAGARNLELAKQNLSTGTHSVSVTVTDPAGGAPATRTWTIDNTGPQVAATVTAPTSSTTGANGEPHYTVTEEFSLKLVPTDDQPGYVVAEFRLDGDGWHNYYGWPTDKNAPFRFTPTGTNVDDLIYGNLGSGGMSLSPFTQRTPGYGTHRVEYRAIDAAGNYGPVKAFTVTVRKDGAQGADQIINATVKAGGGLTMTSVGGVVTLPAVQLTGIDQITSGALNQVKVTDTRGTATAWSLTGQVSDFSGGQGVIPGANLGWVPTAEVVGNNDLPTNGGSKPAVTPGGERQPGSGISEASTLCSTAAGSNTGQFACGAGLNLGVPGSARTGDYSAVLTLTLI